MGRVHCCHSHTHTLTFDPYRREQETVEISWTHVSAVTLSFVLIRYLAGCFHAVDVVDVVYDVYVDPGFSPVHSDRF